VIAAGDFAAWLAQAQAALRGRGGTEVPCGDCVGCCSSGYSVQVRPEDARAAALIPAAYLQRPPGFGAGQQTMPPLANGHCPMLRGGQCTIYAQRPQTCLDYDCRVFAAAGIDAGGVGKATINERVRSWRFSYAADADRQRHVAIRAAAAFLADRRAAASGVTLPGTPMGIAVYALKTHTVFLQEDHAQRSDAELARAMQEAARQFDTPQPARNGGPGAD
jgi:hypothetical protein